MKIYCIEDFKRNVERLVRNKSYSSLQRDIIEYFFSGKGIQEVKSGTRLNNSDETPYIKKRLNGSGGYRIYYLLVFVKDSVYLMYVHPKTGSMGIDNLTRETIRSLYRKVYECIETKDLYLVQTSKDKSKLIFSRV
jgi:hypothetical protein